MSNGTQMTDKSDKQRDIKSFVKKIKDLPTLPQYMLKASKIVNNPQSSAKDLAKVISEDQVLAARLLRLVNSSFYGFPQKVTTITSAIVLLGFEAIRNLLLTTSIMDIFSKNIGTKENAEELWNHVLCCGVVSKVIGEKINYQDTEELFVAGLLHDIGKTLELVTFPEKYREINEISKHRNVYIKQIEEEIFGIGHDSLGKLLATYWKLPKSLQDAMEYHHNLEGEFENSKLVYVVHVADTITKTIEIIFGYDTVVPEINKTAWENLGLDIEDLQAIIGRSISVYSEMKKTEHEIY